MIVVLNFMIYVTTLQSSDFDIFQCTIKYTSTRVKQIIYITSIRCVFLRPYPVHGPVHQTVLYIVVPGLVYQYLHSQI